MELVLSLFPGIDLLGRAFSATGFSVVKGPDLIWDERIEDFNTPANHFNGIIGGPPCQNYSDANRNRDPEEGDRLLKEFLRIVTEAQPEWFLCENVRNVPDIILPGWQVQRLDVTDTDAGGTQLRLRHIHFGSKSGDIIRPQRTERLRPVTPTMTCRNASEHDRHSRRLARQGAPPLPLRALTPAARSRALGNAVSYRVALILAAAVQARRPVTPTDCPCQCGRVTHHGTLATAACRKRMQRRRQSHTRQVTFP